MITENTLLGTIAISLCGVVVIIIRKSKLKEKANEYALDAIEWLILGTAPLIPASELLPPHKEWSNVFIAGYAGILVSWFAILWLSKKEDPEKARKAFPYIVLNLVIGIIFLIITWHAIS